MTRASFVADINIIQDTNISGALVLAGEFATTFFSTLMGVIGCAKLMQALARDELYPGLSIFGQGTKKGDEPVYAICATYIAAQVVMLFDINQIASLITMAYLVCYPSESAFLIHFFTGSIYFLSIARVNLMLLRIKVKW